MSTKHHRNQTPWFVLIVSCACMALAVYTLFVKFSVDSSYQTIASITGSASETGPAKAVQLPNNSTTLVIANWQLFTDHGIWVYLSPQHRIADGFAPNELVASPVSTGGDTSMQVDHRIRKPLQALFTAAENEGIDLMLSSAYRSVDDQRTLYESFVTDKGEALAHEVVAKPGTSEHHTGLAVDITDASASCRLSTNQCNLSPASAAWLARHAPQYGFILRYPDGSRPITGITFEPWHFRYVGRKLAEQLTASGLTYDEFVQQAAPGYAKANQ